MNIEQLKQEFVNIYGEGEISGFFSPGRVNLIGEHTDYNGGYVFPCALSFGTYCLIRKTNKPVFRFASINVKNREELSLDELTTPLKKGNWANYPLGTIAQFVKQGFDISTGADLMFYGNVPNGAGLSSSASLEIATAVAVNDVYGFGVEKVELVKMGQKAEHEFAGVNCGIMDQFASGMGAADSAIFLNCDTLEYELVPVKLDGVKIVISNTNSPHSLGSGEYNERVAQCQAAVDALKPYTKINQLADISWDEFKKLEDKIEDETVRRRARHVVSEIERTVEAVDALKAGRLEYFGELMNASHDSLRDDYEVTGKELDAMVEEAREIEGVIGSRMTGGGFGGSTVSLVKDEAVDTFIENVGKNYQARTGLKPEFYVAEIGKGGHKVF
ncbi:MAG: galactokinase [Prolixibacteraceae bacterium]|jgi:galactokinase|nr:galactokinase [Prolixibacteraceae bacterium]